MERSHTMQRSSLVPQLRSNTAKEVNEVFKKEGVFSRVGDANDQCAQQRMFSILSRRRKAIKTATCYHLTPTKITVIKKTRQPR